MTSPKIVRIDGVIGTGEGEVSAQMVREQLPENGIDPIKVELHSEGGAVFEGFAIHDICAAYQGPKTLSIQSSAFSIASFIAMAFDDVEISSNGYMMLHNPYSRAEGDDEELTQQATMLAQLKSTMVAAYAARSGKTEDEIRAILKNETYLNAQQSVDMGFVSRISGKPVIGRAFAKRNMPLGVVAALFGADSSGDNNSKKGCDPMSESRPVAATLEEIEAAFPKAKAGFVLSCLRKSLPMASVASAAVEEMMSENAALQAQVAAMTEELAAAKAGLPTEEEPDAMEIEIDPEPEPAEPTEPDEEQAMEEEETTAKAKAKGVKPVAKSRTGSGFKTATAKWKTQVNAGVASGKTRAQAIIEVDRQDPSLRAAMLAENSGR